MELPDRIRQTLHMLEVSVPHPTVGLCVRRHRASLVYARSTGPQHPLSSRTKDGRYRWLFLDGNLVLASFALMAWGGGVEA